MHAALRYSLGDTPAFQTAQDPTQALEGAPWLADLIAYTFPTGEAPTPDLEAVARCVPKEITRRVWAAPLPISKRLYAAMKWRRNGGAWKERPAAGEVFHSARGWALAEAFGINLAELIAEPMEDVGAHLRATFEAGALGGASHV